MSNHNVTKKYVDDLQEALRDLLLMTSEREQIEIRIAKQKKRVAALYELVQTDEDGAAFSGLVDGITDACRVVFRAAEKPLSPSEVRDRVQALGLPPQANLLASVHTTLKRMREAGEIKEAIDAMQGKAPPVIVYQWAGERIVNNLWQRMLSVSELAIDPEKLPESVRGAIHPTDLLSNRGHRVPATAGEAKRTMEALRPKK